jgi:hypothetical protein
MTQATKHILWHIKVAQDVTTVELLLSTQPPTATSNNALYIYQLNTGVCLHVIQLNFFPTIQHLLGHACMLKGNGLLNVMVLATRPQQRDSIGSIDLLKQSFADSL